MGEKKEKLVKIVLKIFLLPGQIIYRGMKGAKKFARSPLKNISRISNIEREP